MRSCCARPRWRRWGASRPEAVLPLEPLDTSIADVAARGLRIELPHPVAGQVPLVGSPFHFSDTPVSYHLPPPRLGEHTDAVLGGLLGRSAADIAALRASGVL